MSGFDFQAWRKLAGLTSEVGGLGLHPRARVVAWIAEGEDFALVLIGWCPEHRAYEQDVFFVSTDLVVRGAYVDGKGDIGSPEKARLWPK